MKVNMMSLSGLMNIRWSTSPWPLSSIENSLVEASVRVAPSIQNVVSAGMWRSPSVAKLMVTFSPLTDNTGARRHHWQWCSDKFNVYISLFCSTNDVLTPNPFFGMGIKTPHMNVWNQAIQIEAIQFSKSSTAYDPWSPMQRCSLPSLPQLEVQRAIPLVQMDTNGYCGC